MSAEPYNEPAFPIAGGLHEHQFAGMTLRDYFAAKALAAMLANPDKEGANRGRNGVALFAGFAYEYADAMLLARAPAPTPKEPTP